MKSPNFAIRLASPCTLHRPTWYKLRSEMQLHLPYFCFPVFLKEKQANSLFSSLHNNSIILLLLSPLCRMFTVVCLKQTMLLGYTVLQLICAYSLWYILCYFPLLTFCNFTSVIFDVCARCPVWLVFCNSLMMLLMTLLAEIKIQKNPIGRINSLENQISLAVLRSPFRF